MRKLKLFILPEEFVVWQLPPDAPVPEINYSGIWSVTRTDDELSVVSIVESVPEDVQYEKGWKCIGVKGQLEFELTGILAFLSTPLAQAGISVFSISTFNTDYLLVKTFQLELARTILEQAGNKFID